MKAFKRSMTILMTAVLLTTCVVPCSASDSAVRDLFENVFYGGMVGTLVGGSLLAFTRKPADHLNYISVGAATGVLGGVAYSVAKSTRALVSIENGDVKLAMPTVLPELQDNGTKGAASVMLKAELIRGKF